jgi:hypothetical protein
MVKDIPTEIDRFPFRIISPDSNGPIVRLFQICPLSVLFPAPAQLLHPFPIKLLDEKEIAGL